MERYIGEIKIMDDPKFEDIRIMWMTNEQWFDAKKNKSRHFPSVWLVYEGLMYHAISCYEFQWFESYEDFLLPGGKPFDCWCPERGEWEYLTNLGLQYRELDYRRAILDAADLDEWCDFELGFIKEWHRNKIIDDTLK